MEELADLTGALFINVIAETQSSESPSPCSSIRQASTTGEGPPWVSGANTGANTVRVTQRVRQSGSLSLDRSLEVAGQKQRGTSADPVDETEPMGRRWADISEDVLLALDALEDEVIKFAVDSGASVTMMPPDLALKYPLLPNPESKRGKSYRSAKGEPVVDKGTRALIGRFGNSPEQRGMKVRIGNIVRPLCSVWELVHSGNRVVFDTEDNGGSYCEDKNTKKKYYFREENRAYILDMTVTDYDDLPKALRIQSLDQSQGNGEGHANRTKRGGTPAYPWR